MSSRSSAEAGPASATPSTMDRAATSEVRANRWSLAIMKAFTKGTIRPGRVRPARLERSDDCDSIARHRRVDLVGPCRDSALQVVHGLEPGAREQHRGLLT